MGFWIELVMKYKEILISIREIKKQREDFINNFQTDKNFVYESLMKAIDFTNETNDLLVHGADTRDEFFLYNSRIEWVF